VTFWVAEESPLSLWIRILCKQVRRES